MGLQIAEHIDAPMREQKATPIRVLLVDDHVILRHGIRMMLNVFGDFKRKMQDIYRKFQVTDRAHAVAEAMCCGLI